VELYFESAPEINSTSLNASVKKNIGSEIKRAEMKKEGNGKTKILNINNKTKRNHN